MTEPDAEEETRGYKPPPLGVLTAIVAISAPAAMAIETGLRTAFFPAEFHEVRQFLHDILAPWAWATAAATIVFALVGFVLFRVSAPKAIARAPEQDKEPGKALMDRFMLTSSIPQVPAIAGTLLFMFGSPLLPILIAMVISSAGVVAQGIVARGMSPA